jgi:hypothetical protein
LQINKTATLFIEKKMLKYAGIFLLLIFYFPSFAQNSGIKGNIKDQVTGETLIGASVSIGPGKGVATDLDGNFVFNLEPGEYTLTISYVGYNPIEKKVTVDKGFVNLNFDLETKVLNEVQVVADIAISRKTPVAFSNIPIQKIQEQLGTQDLPLVLNSTPGVYATPVGGGDGDARISIRGFNSQNVMVLMDGIPMNDMFNGRVFWSNWFGLDNITKGMQVQRGLGASKLAIPAIGGTINILTSGIESKRMFAIKEELGNNFNFRSTLSMTSGRLKGNWGVTGAISYRRNDGWVDQLSSRMFFYYLKFEKTLGKHNLSLTGFGAPQTSGQRDFRIDQSVATYSLEEAYNLGIDTTGKTKLSYGRRYNPSWGYLRRTRGAVPGAKQEIVNTSVNQFHKPVFSLKDFWSINDKFYLSNIVYASYGRGGGTQPNNNIPSAPGTFGEQNIQNIYDGNAYNTVIVQPIPGERLSTNFIRKNYNDHDWFGFLSTFSYKMNSKIELSGGIDGRRYQGRVYSKVDDLLGGDYIQTNTNPNEEPKAIKREGDIIQQNIHRFINWSGAFVMAEYRGGWYTAFLNLSGSYSGYRQVNYFLPKTLEVGDTTLNIGYGDTIVYQGNQYTRESEGLEYASSDWVYLGGFTAKGGMNFNITEKQNVFFNIGYLSRAPLMQFVFASNNDKFKNVKNELIQSLELGYSFRSKWFSTNINGYYTIWDNRPTRTTLTVNGEPVSTNAEGMQAIHKGVEMDFVFQPFKWIALEGMVTLSDWRWNSVANATLLGDNGDILDEQKFDPRGVRVGDAAQRSYGASLRIEPIKGLYLKPQYVYFTHNFANFNPESLVITDLEKGWGPNVGRQSWRMPDYGLLDISIGYGFITKEKKIDIRGTVMNALDSFYISDAQSNQYSPTFDAAGASVNVGPGIRWVTSVTLTF